MRKRTAKRIFVFFVIPVLLIAIWMFSSVNAAANRICVCHVENKETGSGHVIEVDANSLEGHLKHGDVQCTVDCEQVVGTSCDAVTGGECKERSD